MHRVFISYHHANDQEYEDKLVKWAEKNNVFENYSVDTGDISDELSDEEIRIKIRDEYLSDTRVTLLLVGTETKNRKHVDWELYSSMHDGKINKKSSIIVVMLPSTKCTHFRAAFQNERDTIYPNSSWKSLKTKVECRERYPYMPERIIDNLVHDGAKISIINWSDLSPSRLKMMVDNAYDYAGKQDYDLSSSMKRRNS